MVPWTAANQELDVSNNSLTTDRIQLASDPFAIQMVNVPSRSQLLLNTGCRRPLKDLVSLQEMLNPVKLVALLFFPIIRHVSLIGMSRMVLMVVSTVSF